MFEKLKERKKKIYNNLEKEYSEDLNYVIAHQIKYKKDNTIACILYVVAAVVIFFAPDLLMIKPFMFSILFLIFAFITWMNMNNTIKDASKQKEIDDRNTDLTMYS